MWDIRIIVATVLYLVSHRRALATQMLPAAFRALAKAALAFCSTFSRTSEELIPRGCAPLSVISVPDRVSLRLASALF